MLNNNEVDKQALGYAEKINKQLFLIKNIFRLGIPQFLVHS